MKDVTWVHFWNKENNIHASSLHRETHYQVLGADVLELLPKDRPLVLLDWGCGEAHAASFWSKHGILVFLYDPTPRLDAYIKKRFREADMIKVLELKDVKGLSSNSLDAVLIYSVLQYIPKEDIEETLALLHRLLKSGGMLILGDIVPPSNSLYSDILDVLSVGWRHGLRLFTHVVKGLVLTAFSDYRTFRDRNGFSLYSDEEMQKIASKAGFSLRKARKNIGLSNYRTTYMLIKEGLVK